MKEDYHMTADEITAQVAEIHTRMDEAFTTLCDDALELERLVCEAVKIGMVKPLAGKKAIRQAQMLRGEIASAAHSAADMHVYHHKVAQSQNPPVATPDLTRVGGVVVLGPGR